MKIEPVGDRFVRGATWMLASKLVERGLGLVSTLILARLLLPGDFGLVAMAAPVIGLVELLGAFGFDFALIRKANITRADYDTAFTLNILVSIMLASVLWIAAPFGAEFFREPRLAPVLAWLALGTLIQGFGNPGMVAFRKEISMGPGVAVLLGQKVTSLVVATSAALILGNYWALVWGTLASRFVGVALSYGLSPYRPRFSLASRREIMGFSSWILLGSFLGFLHLRANDFIIGRLLGPTSLAYFNISIELASTVTGEAMSAISRAAYPTFSLLTADLQRLRNGVRQVLAGLATFAFPAGFGMAAIAELMVRVVLGERWLPATSVLAGLAIVTAFLGLLHQVQQVYMALGHPRFTTALTGLFVAVLIGLSIWLIPIYGLAAIPSIYGAVTATMAVGHFVCMRKLLPAFLPGDWVSALWRPLLASLLMYGVVRLAEGFAGNVPGLAPLALLIGLMITGAVAYSVFLYGMWRMAGSPDGPEALIERRLVAASGAVVRRLRR